MSYYDATAKGYNELHGEEQLRKARVVLAFLKAHKLIDEHSRLLDVGAGTTHATAIFPGDRTAIEPAKELLKQCKDPSIKLVYGVAEDLPFADGWFDVVICLTAVHNFTNLEKGLDEIKRVASKTIVITILKKSPKYASIMAAIKKRFKQITSIDDQTDTILVLK
jgi:ubiquinone/menaquinone biosynthesis C-methylase UbiE